ncbi:hypothetical protein HMPREF3171_03530 [Corynebacterium sp. HMSC08F01]|uniref:alpha/beta hydrolase n=1 Tax=Corynebacterium sp. HMSC08F01 TaxID=1581139 RepID=UPI0008C449EC|nr:alpha/beta hydrolase family protein [Corynebacterium sp. HMSC08F01]OFT30541.1 hypothetical protein HMPREF3171_03530 [Corynebacterium sp. HMSC08F01]
MKLTRPAIAAAAVALVTAGAVPVVHYASSLDDDTPAVLSAAQSTVNTTLPETTTSETTEPTEKSTTSETSATSTSNEPTPTTSELVPEGSSKDTTNEDLTSKDGKDDSATDADADATVLSEDAAKLNPMGEDMQQHPAIKELGEVPKTMSGADQRWVKRLADNQHVWKNEALRVHSESMERDIPVAVFYATNDKGETVENAPTVYLLNGAGGSEQDTDWVSQALEEVHEVYGRSGANVVIPMEGAFSYYVDWAAEPPTEKNVFYKGKQMWSTFLAKELPQAIEPYIKADPNRRGVIGMSMSATSSLLLAEHNPNMFKAVGSFSGCPATSRPLPSFFINLTVDRAAPGVMTPEYIFGPMGSDYNRRYDALVNAPALAGTDTKVYISTGTGLAAETDMPGTLRKRLEDAGLDSSDAFVKGSANAATLLVEGGAIEAAMNACTHDFLVKARANGAEVAHAELRPVGTHSWPVWRDDLKRSYETVFKSALGL